jgi:CobQ-like glutamine amidotransferase family enzyme
MPERHLTIVWLYHDLMNLYGDRGNVLTLAHRARARGIAVRTVGCSLGEEMPSDTDIVFFGGGQDQEQVLVAGAINSWVVTTIRSKASASQDLDFFRSTRAQARAA